jgi:dihydroorotate dehydrogenase
MLEKICRRTAGRIPVVAVGGISTVDQAIQAFKAGASLIQIYTALVYEGPLLVRRLNYGLYQYLSRQGAKSLAELRPA